MTDPLGSVFISYRRNRLQETNALVHSMRDRGIPTWRDVDDLQAEPTEEAITRALGDKSTSGAVLWITPDVKCSNIIKYVEVRLAVHRYRRNDGFWLTLVLADGTDYGDLTTVLDGALGAEDLKNWNVTKVSQGCATVNEINSLARTCLDKRLGAIIKDPVASNDLHFTVDAKGTVSKHAMRALAVDWTPYFSGRLPVDEDWDRMKTAWSDIAQLSKARISKSQSISLSGTPSLPASMLMGSRFSTRDGSVPTWQQRMPDGVSVETWAHNAVLGSGLASELGWSSTTRLGSADADSLAVLVNISDRTEIAIGNSRTTLPTWRAVLAIDPRDARILRELPLSAAETASLVHLTVDAIRSIRHEVLPIRSIHVFVAGPAGFCVLLGMQLATLPPVHTYEFDTSTQTYLPAIRLTS